MNITGVQTTIFMSIPDIELLLKTAKTLASRRVIASLGASPDFSVLIESEPPPASPMPQHNFKKNQLIFVQDEGDGDEWPPVRFSQMCGSYYEDTTGGIWNNAKPITKEDI